MPINCVNFLVGKGVCEMVYFNDNVLLSQTEIDKLIRQMEKEKEEKA